MAIPDADAIQAMLLQSTSVSPTSSQENMYKDLYVA